MIASQCSFNYMKKIAEKTLFSAETLSYFQVEYGLDYLRSLWDCFVDAHVSMGVDFTNKSEIIGVFIEGLTDLLLEETQEVAA